jgi:hypothetical protein
MSDLEARVSSLEERLAAVEAGRPGRKARPILVSIEGVCGIDPHRDSATCPDASVYRKQKGCKGTRCSEISAEYYAAYRANGSKKVTVRRRRTK